MSRADDELAAEVSELAQTIGLESRSDELDRMVAHSQVPQVHMRRPVRVRERWSPQVVLGAGICVALVIGLGVVLSVGVKSAETSLLNDMHASDQVLVDPWAEHLADELPESAIDAQGMVGEPWESYRQALSHCDGESVCAVDAALAEIEKNPDSGGLLVWNEAVDSSDIEVTAVLGFQGEAVVGLVAHDQNQGRVVYLRPHTYEVLSHDLLRRTNGEAKLVFRFQPDRIE